jgi:hypothetical protein
MKRSIFAPLIIVAGIFVFLTIFLIFGPAIFATASAENDLSKYANHSDEGNTTIAGKDAIDGFLVGVYAGPFPIVYMLVGVFMFLISLIVVAKLVMKKRKGHSF